MSLAVIAIAFGAIFVVELPDKTFVATLVLATRFRHLWVWIGVAAAFFVQMLIAVTAGGLLALLPERLVLGVTAALFAVGAVIMIRGGLASRAQEARQQRLPHHPGTDHGSLRHAAEPTRCAAAGSRRRGRARPLRTPSPRPGRPRPGRARRRPRAGSSRPRRR